MDANGQLLRQFTAGSRLEVARRVVRTHYDPFRLQVSSSYREVFNRDLDRTLRREQWRIVSLHGGPRRGLRGAATERWPAHAA
jgi:hypothetical protein